MTTFFYTAYPFGPTVPPGGAGHSSFQAAQPQVRPAAVYFGQTTIETNINNAANQAGKQAKHSAKTFQQFLKDLKPKPYWADELRYGAAVVLREVIPSALDFSYHLPFAGLLFSVVGWIPGKITPLIADYIAPQGPPVFRGYTLQELHEWQKRGLIKGFTLPSLEKAFNSNDMALLTNAKLNQRLTELITENKIRAPHTQRPGGLAVLRGYTLKELYDFDRKGHFKGLNIKLPALSKALSDDEVRLLHHPQLGATLRILADKQHKIRPSGLGNYSFIRRLERLMQSYRVLNESIEQLAETYTRAAEYVGTASNPNKGLPAETNLVIKRFMNELQQFFKSIFKPTLGISISLDHKKGAGKLLMKALEVRAVYTRGFAGNSKTSRFISKAAVKLSQFERKAKFLKFILWPVKAILTLVQGGGMLWNRSKILKILAR